MDSSSDISHNFSRSFSEYNSSGLEDENSGQFDDKLEHPLTKTLNAVMSNKAASNSTLKSAQNVAKLINELPGSPVNLPTNINSLKKSATMRFEREYHLFCAGCTEFCDRNNWCKKCKLTTKKNKTNFIIYIPLKQQIKAIIDKYFDEIISYMNRNRCAEKISDVDDGKLMLSLRQKNPGTIILGFTINADGAQVHNSQKNSVWPVQLYSNFLPPNLRFKSENIIVTTLYYGREKPEIAKLLYHLSNEINQLATEKISFYRSTNIYHCKPVIINCSADLPARSMLSGLKLFNGAYSCILCLHPGLSITDHFNSKYIRYVNVHPTPPLRTHQSIIKAIEKLSLSRSSKIKSVDGFMTMPPMLLFNEFDLSKSFAVDYMHNVLLGIMKLLLDMWFGSHRLCKQSPYFKPMTLSQRQKLDERILDLKPYERISRKPTSILDRAFYKATEYKMLLLFYLPVALEGLLDKKQLEHFKLLSASIYILLQHVISTEELHAAHEMLIKFCDDFETIYGPEAVTMNVHLLRHHKDNVLNHGPLWATSMFGFEQNIGVITKCTKNISTDDIEVMSFNFCLWKPSEIAEKHVIQLMRGKNTELPEAVGQALQSRNINSTNNIFFAGDAVNFKTQHFKSRKSNETKSVDYFMEMCDGQIGSVYIYVKYEDQIYVVLEQYNVIEKNFHIRKVKKCESYKVYLFDEIANKMLFLKFPHAEVLTKEPNYFEH